MDFKKTQRFLIGASLLLVVIACQPTQGRPYFFFQSAQPSPTEAPTSEKVASEAKETAVKAEQAVQSATNQARETISGVNVPKLPQKLSGHLSSLYEHGQTAMKGVVDTVQPDISNIGRDITEIYQQTRENVGRRIEPIGQTLKPLIDHAQKVVAPYMNQAREEVPKLLEQARPTIAKAGEQIRGGLNTAWSRISSTVSEVTNPAEQKSKEIGHKIEPKNAQATLTDAAKAVEAKVTPSAAPAAAK